MLKADEIDENGVPSATTNAQLEQENATTATIQPTTITTPTTPIRIDTQQPSNNAQGYHQKQQPSPYHHPTPPNSARQTGANLPTKNAKPKFHMQNKIKIIPAARRSELNIQYVLTLPGVLKLVEISLGFVAFVLTICADRNATTAAWTEHITFETTLVVSGFLLGYVVFPHITIANERTKNGLQLVELLFYSSNALFYFISIWLMIHLSASWVVDGKGAAIMSAIICVVLCILYSVETFLKFRTWHLGDNASSTKQAQFQHSPTIPPPPTSVVAHAHSPSNATATTVELHREHSVV